MNITERILAGLLIGGLLAGPAFTGTAFADPAPHSNASCMGRESETSPGSVPVGRKADRTPSEDNRPAVLILFALVAGDDVKNLGGAMSEFAQLDANTHEACDGLFVDNHTP